MSIFFDINDVSGSGNDGSDRALNLPIVHKNRVAEKFATLQFLEDNPHIIPMDVPKTITLKVGIRKNFYSKLIMRK